MEQSGCVEFGHALVVNLAKYVISEVSQRIEKPPDARGSEQSRDRKGAMAAEYENAFTERSTKLEEARRAKVTRTVER